MSHFYGKVFGRAKHAATRCGTKVSGLIAELASRRGAVRVELHNREDGKDIVTISLVPWLGVGVHRQLYVGPIDDSWPL